MADLKTNFNKPRSATVATEFIGTSITSRLTTSAVDRIKAARSANPYVKFFEGRPGGYVHYDLDASRWTSSYRLANSALDPQSPVRNIASFVVENGRPGATRV